MNLGTYEKSGQALYEGLAQVVASILTAAIAQDPTLRPQQIQHRAKELPSLKRKLERADAEEDAEVEAHAKDLAGARVIFYTNSDVSRFQTSGILTENFEVDWDRTKFHHPTSPAPAASELFESNNYVVKLKSERASLPEYARYAGLWCEVQVQTTLNHAWAEMAHDTIYKKPALSGFGGSLMKGIESRMQSIMRDYLAPAGYAFQKVLADFDRLSRGQELFELGVISAIKGAADNNEVHETLTKVLSSVLPYCDDYKSISDELLTGVSDAVKRSRQIAVRPIETPFGSYDGKTSDDVAKAAAGIIEDLRFVDVDKTFSTICELYLGAVGKEEPSIWVKLAETLAEHHMGIWNQAGPYIQSVLVDRIGALPKDDRLALKPLILVMLKQFFSTELSGTTSSFESITIHSGAIAPSNALRDIRQKALQIVREFDVHAQSDEERRELINVYASAMALPHIDRPVDPELAAIVFENSADIVSGYAINAGSWSYELRQKVEHSLLWLYRHYGKKPDSYETVEATEKARSDMVAAILAFRDSVNSDDGFTTYKLLVGFESVFPPAWDDHEFDYQQEEAFREDRINEIIKEVTAENADKWLAIIRRCAATESNDLATFPTFGKFLEKLSSTKPKIALGYLSQADARLANFLAPIARGLGQTSDWPETEALLRSWIANGRFVSDVAWAFGSVESIPITVLRAALDQAVAQTDIGAAYSAIQSISRRNNNENAKELRQPFLDAVAFMTAQNDPRWIHGWFAIGKPSALLSELDQSETSVVLRSLVGYPRVEAHLEWFLADIASRFPQLVIDYFGDRLERRFSDEAADRHGAIPYSLDRLKKVLATSPELTIGAARAWFSKHPQFFSYYGGKFVEVIFPQLSPEVEKLLNTYVTSGDRKDIEFVIETLRAYSGESFLYPLCMNIVGLLETDDPLLGAVESVLQPSGTSWGEFGHVERLKGTRNAIASWASDERKSVRAFAARYAKRMELSIAAEQRRGEESIALRKLEYDEPDTEEPVPQ